MLPQTLRELISDKNTLKSQTDTAYFFRACSPKFGTQMKLSRLQEAAFGSLLTGGRFNQRGQFHVLYLSVDRETCLAELDKYAQRGGVTLKKRPYPVTLAPWEIKLSCVLDLTDAQVREKLQINEQTLCETDWETLQNYYEIIAATQRLGKLARDVGFVALLTPSAAKSGGKNLSVFIDNVEPETDICEVCGIDDFPT